MSNEREALIKSYEDAFGKAPRKNMKVETMRKRIEEASPTEDKESPENPQVTAKMAELVEIAKAANDGEVPVVISLVLGKKGIHMSMSGEGQDIAIMVATAICSEPRVGAVLSNGAMMAQMRMNAEKGEIDSEGNELAPEGMPTAQTEA